MTLPLWTETYTYADSNHIKTHFDDDKGAYYEGFVATPHGYVYVWCRRWGNGEQSTRMEFIHDQLLHMRQWDVAFRPRYLVTLAKRFAHDIAWQVENARRAFEEKRIAEREAKLAALNATRPIVPWAWVDIDEAMIDLREEPTP